MKKNEDRSHPLFPTPTLELFTVPDVSIAADPLGSYTGRPWNKYGIPEEMLETPVQDADDL